MKLATYQYKNTITVGVVTPDESMIYPLSAFGLPYADMSELIQSITAEEKNRIHEMLQAPNQLAGGVELKETELLSPIPTPGQDVICLGINYFDHAKESEGFTSIKYTGKKEPTIYFSKRVNEAVAPYGEIQGHLDIVKDLDYEVELAVIIGKDALDVAPEDVQDYIFGYTILNDISARTFQSTHKQWYRGKSLDGFTPIGPWIVTADEIAYPPVLRLQSRVNGELRQNNTSDHLIHDITEIISEISTGMTLKAGTIIATGTPSGVAMGMEQPKYLNEGDVVECTIEQIGTIRNKVRR